MADDNRLRSFQSSNPSRREAVPASERSRANDPLAELARLIGQGDPFVEPASPRPADPAPRQSLPVPTPTTDWRNRPPPYALMRSQAAAPATHYQPVTPATHYQPARSAPADHYTDNNRYADDEQGYATEPQFSDPSYQDSPAYSAGHDGHDDGYYDDGTAGEQYDNTVHGDPPRASRRGALVTALTLIGCATLGTAGAYGYRTYYNAPSSGPAPVIVADRTPTKVVAAADTQSSKPIQDRVGEASATERMVPREEQPVVLKPAPATAAPPVMFAPTGPATTASIGTSPFPPPPGPAAAPAAAAPAATAEPKRVRTIPIRPDRSDVSGRPQTAAPAHSAAAPKAARGAPLQLDPQQSSETTATTSAPSAQRPLTPPAPRLASAPSNGGTGGYVVQLSSQRSESEAQASFRALQAKYPSALSDRSPIIRRADLGAKGVFYRALVGPFGSASEAGHLCSSLKAAGGQCIVQKN
jgi:hypothetical protein